VLKRIIFIGLLLQFTLPASAELRIEITKGVDNAVRVAVVPFAWRGKRKPPIDVGDVVSSDLGLSGRFEALPTSQMLSFPNDSSEVLPRDWRMLGVEYLVVGYLEPREVSVRLHFELYSVLRQTVVAKQTIEGLPMDLRDMAHHVSDVVFNELTGIKGAFSTQIMYVTAMDDDQGRHFALNIADADGYRVRKVLESIEPILSATWSPDGKWIAFTMLVPDKPEPFTKLPPQPKGAEWAEAARVIRKLVYRSDGQGYLQRLAARSAGVGTGTWALGLQVSAFSCKKYHP
jgi:TolB protein